MTKRIDTTDAAAAILRAGGLVAFPTETVFGLGVDATNEQAVRRLFEAKGRPSNNPLIVHVADPADWPLAAREMTRAGEALLGAFSPGPITVVLPKREAISPLVTGGLDTVGVRAPAHGVAQAILRSASVPIAAPSANRSGRPSCTTWHSVLEDLEGRIDAVFCQDADGCGIESTVVDCTGAGATVLRSGAITLEQIHSLVPDAQALPTGRAVDEGLERPRSPGLAHPHYRPNARVMLIDRPEEATGEPIAYCGVAAAPTGADNLVHSAVFPDTERYAAGFYEFLREADRRGAATIFVQRATGVGLGTALLDRQQRAAGEL